MVAGTSISSPVALTCVHQGLEWLAAASYAAAGEVGGCPAGPGYPAAGPGMAPVPGPGYGGGMAGYNAATKQLLEQFEELTLGPSAPGQPQDAGGLPSQ